MNNSRNSAAVRSSRSVSSERISADSTFSVNSCARIVALTMCWLASKVVGGPPGILIEARDIGYAGGKVGFGGKERIGGLLARGLVDSSFDEVLGSTIRMGGQGA